MQASIVELRYKMKDVLKALDRNESVKIMYHGREKGILLPLKKTTCEKVGNHPFFGSARSHKISVQNVMQQLRGGRY